MRCGDVLGSSVELEMKGVGLVCCSSLAGMDLDGMGVVALSTYKCWIKLLWDLY
jgi:hypothetical protein